MCFVLFVVKWQKMFVVIEVLFQYFRQLILQELVNLGLRLGLLVKMFWVLLKLKNGFRFQKLGWLMWWLQFICMELLVLFRLQFRNILGNRLKYFCGLICLVVINLVIILVYLVFILAWKEKLLYLLLMFVQVVQIFLLNRKLLVNLGRFFYLFILNLFIWKLVFILCRLVCSFILNLFFLVKGCIQLACQISCFCSFRLLDCCFSLFVLVFLNFGVKQALWMVDVFSFLLF